MILKTKLLTKTNSPMIQPKPNNCLSDPPFAFDTKLVLWLELKLRGVEVGVKGGKVGVKRGGSWSERG